MPIVADIHFHYRRAIEAANAAYPHYDEYQAKTTRKIPVFIAEPRT